MKSKSLAILLLCFTNVLVLAPFASADGPPRNTPRRVEPDTEYASTALDAYGEGYAFIERATRFDHDAEAANDEESRRSAIEGAKQSYEDALDAFENAVRIDPRMYEAHTYIGYANRKLGRYEQALEAYASALKLKHDYVRAIEYQGEAYLGLDRFEDAKFNYQRLYALDNEQAQKLLAAMRAWAAERRADARSVSRQELDAAAEWLNDQPETRMEKIATTPW